MAEVLYEPTGDLGRDERLACHDGSNGFGQLMAADVFQQEAAGPGFHGLVEVCVAVEGGEDKYSGWVGVGR